MEEEHTESIFVQLKKNKFLVIILVISLILGIYLRFDDYGAEGYITDDANTIPAAVFAYYPHDYFPGLVSTEPPLGNYIIGLGCIASGEDFSKVSKVKPLFFPDRSAYIGQAAKNAENYCWIPIYTFGLLFLIGIILFAFLFFSDVYASTYFITFFIFFSTIISSSRKLKVDIILFTFVIFALIFLWKGYSAKKGMFKEKLYFFLTFAFLGLAGATKFSAGAVIIFSFLLLLEKYHKELIYLLQKILKQIDITLLENKIDGENTNFKSLLTNIILAVFSSGFFLITFFNFSLKNLWDTYYYLTSLNNPEIQSFGLSIHSLYWLKDILANLNIFDIFIYLFSVFIFLKLVFKKHKTTQEKFILYLTLLGLFIPTLLRIVNDVVHGIPFMFGFFILMSLAFSNKEYSIFNILKINKKYFLVFISVYSITSFLILYPAPFHNMTNNQIICPVFKFDSCQKNLLGYSAKPVSLYFDSVLNEDETFLPTGIYNFYTRYNDDIMWWVFYSSFKKQTGKEPRLEDYLKYYKPEGRRVRYIHTDTSLNTNPNDLVDIGIDQNILKKNYKPLHVIKLYNRDVAYIYDLANLIKK